MALVASLWRRAWTRSRASGRDDDAGGGRALHPTTGGDSTASGTTYTTSTTSSTTYTTSTTSDSVGESHPRDFHASMAPSTEPIIEENSDEELDLDVAEELKEDMKKKLEHIKGLVEEFRGDDRRALVSWLSELDAGWVRHLATAHKSSGSVVTSHGFQFLVEWWILALRKIGESTILTGLDVDGWYSQRKRKTKMKSKRPSASEFAELVQATVLKMLPFVDIIAAAKTTEKPGPVALAPADKLQALIDMHDALCMASGHILLLQVESTCGAMWDLLSANLTKLDEAIWGTICVIKNNIMAWTWTHGGRGGGSSDIHKVTNSIVSYSKVLLLHANYGSVSRILQDAVLRAEYVPENGDMSHVSNLIMEMVSSPVGSPEQYLQKRFCSAFVKNYFIPC